MSRSAICLDGVVVAQGRGNSVATFIRQGLIHKLLLFTLMAPSNFSTMSSGSLRSNAQFWSDKGHVLLDQGEYEAALHCFCQAVQEVPTADDYVSQAVSLIHLERPKDALQACDCALSLTSGHARAWLFRGVALHRLGRFHEAYECYDLAAGQQPTQQQRSLWERLKAWFTPSKPLAKGVLKRSRSSHLRVH